MDSHFCPRSYKTDYSFVYYVINTEDVERGYFQPRIKHQDVDETFGDKVIIRATTVALEEPELTGKKDT
ncbi:hypothetical protein HMPREF0044_0737 [Gleimia coleocanis DSM 15436]|uniref:Uncharacterized protein n=1 Tax=Gleimia coleocanis DSM 15436 TaxID=525245 RepID=C0W0Z4_9ACTO|nr:hypothetical protein [Gleimia coleocanis]EEH63718.1 hypothetical protein HMPREF0044_0737 [Gleimia coleocanis DSM 15436]